MKEIKPGTQFRRLDAHPQGGNLVRYDYTDAYGMVWYTYLDNHPFLGNQSWMYEPFFRSQFIFA